MFPLFCPYTVFQSIYNNNNNNSNNNNNNNNNNNVAGKVILTLRLVNVTVITMEKQDVLNVMSVCLYSCLKFLGMQIASFLCHIMRENQMKTFKVYV